MFLSVISFLILVFSYVPLTVVKPVPEAVEAILHQVFCCPKIEPRINCGGMLANVKRIECSAGTGGGRPVCKALGSGGLTLVYYTLES